MILFGELHLESRRGQSLCKIGLHIQSIYILITFCLTTVHPLQTTHTIPAYILYLKTMYATQIHRHTVDLFHIHTIHTFRTCSQNQL